MLQWTSVWNMAAYHSVKQTECKCVHWGGLFLLTWVVAAVESNVKQACPQEAGEAMLFAVCTCQLMGTVGIYTKPSSLVATHCQTLPGLQSPIY